MYKLPNNKLKLNSFFMCPSSYNSCFLHSLPSSYFEITPGVINHKGLRIDNPVTQFVLSWTAHPILPTFYGNSNEFI